MWKLMKPREAFVGTRKGVFIAVSAFPIVLHPRYILPLGET